VRYTEGVTKTSKEEGGKKRLVVLDMHAILHRAYHALPEFSSSKGEPTGALYGLVSILVRSIIDLAPDYVVAAYDLPGPTYRHAAYEKYKAQRTKTDDALVAQIIRSREVLDALGVPHYESEGFEADDVIGTIIEETKKKNNLEVVIASGDMDMLQLLDEGRVRVFRMRKGITDMVLYDEDSFKEEFGFPSNLLPDYKGLRGDTSDNIKGVKGIGEKTASMLIGTFGSLEQLYKLLRKDPKKLEEKGVTKSVIEKLEGGEEDAEFSKMLALIRRDAPINFAVPKKEWREGVDAEKAIEMLVGFEFRSLVPRVKQLIGHTSSIQIPQEKVLSGSQTVFSEDLDAVQNPDEPQGEGLFAEEELPKEAEDLAIAVSVLDPNIAVPTLSDIYRMGKSKELGEARKQLLQEIKERDLTFVYEKIELPLAPVLRRMEERGVKVDKEFLKDLSKEYSAELKKISARIAKAAGGEFNISSPKQLGEVLYDKLGLGDGKIKKTAGGARSTKESELLKLKDQHPIVEDILQYRELSKLLSTYINALPDLLDNEGRVHTTFVQIGAATGRIASIDPNLQNIPVKTELGRRIRNAFVADKGYKLISFDYSQIELRIAAFISGDESLAEIFKSGRDVHSEVAARVFHVKQSDVSYEQRRRAKVINFGILYGMGVNALKDALGTSRGEAQEFYAQYFAAFPSLASYVEGIKADTARKGYTETFFGRRRYFDGIHSSIPYVRASAERMAINAPIQGTQADIVKLAMIKIDELFKEEAKHEACLLLQVHDELVFEIKEARIKTLAPKIKEIMEGVLSLKDTNGIPLKAEGKMGENWGEMERM